MPDKKPPAKPKAPRQVLKDPGGHYVYEGDRRVMGPYPSEAAAYAAMELKQPEGPGFHMERQPSPADVAAMEQRIVGRQPYMTPELVQAPPDIKPIAGSIGGAYAKAAENDKERRRRVIATALRGGR